MPTAAQETEPALTELDPELRTKAEQLVLQSEWSEMSRSERKQWCSAYNTGGDVLWSILKEETNGALSKEAHLSFFGKRC